MLKCGLEKVRVLIAEDEAIVAMQLEDMLHEVGCEVIGPASTLESATSLAHEEMLDVAILDINLEGTYTFTLADELTARGIPVILSSGYGAAMLPLQWRNAPLLGKPYTYAQLETLLHRVVQDRDED